MVFSVHRYISYCLPQTFACEALRGIMLRGWDITYMPVWRGFLVTIIWIVATYVIFKELVNRDKVKKSITATLGTSVNTLILQETGRSGWIGRLFQKMKCWTCKCC